MSRNESHRSPNAARSFAKSFFCSSMRRWVGVSACGLSRGKRNIASFNLAPESPRSVLDGHGFLVLTVHSTLADLVVDHHGVDVTMTEHPLKRVEWHATFGQIRG